MFNKRLLYCIVLLLYCTSVKRWSRSLTTRRRSHWLLFPLLPLPSTVFSLDCLFPLLPLPSTVFSLDCLFPLLLHCSSSLYCLLPKLPLPSAASSLYCSLPRLPLPSTACFLDCLLPHDCLLPIDCFFSQLPFPFTASSLDWGRGERRVSISFYVLHFF